MMYRQYATVLSDFKNKNKIKEVPTKDKVLSEEQFMVDNFITHGISNQQINRRFRLR